MLFIEQITTVEAPRGAVMQIEVTVCTEVLARKEFSVGARHKAGKLLVRQLRELFRRDRLADSELAGFHDRDADAPAWFLMVGAV